MSDIHVSTFDAEHAHGFLSTVFGGLPGLVRICSVEDFTGRAFTTDPAGLVAAVRYAADLDGRGAEGVYFRATTVRGDLAPGRRGGAGDTVAVPILWADVDYGAEGHRLPADAAPNPPDQAAAEALIAAAGLPAPTVLVHSGGGLYPLWRLDQVGRGTDDAGAAAGVQAAILAAARRHGWHYGAGVGDLARVLRLPGSVNRKPDRARPAPCRVIGGSGAPISRAQIPVPAAPVPVTRPPSTAGSLDGLFDAFAAAASWGDILGPVGWTLVDVESSGAELWLRPGGAASPYSARAFEHNIVIHSENAGLPAGPNQALTKARLFAHVHFHGDESRAWHALNDAASGLDSDDGTLIGPLLPDDVLDALGAFLARSDLPPEPLPPMAAQPVAEPWLPDSTTVELGEWAPLFGSRLPAQFFTAPAPPPKPYVLDDLLREGDSGMLVGAPGSGKSLIAFERALDAAKRGHVVAYLDAENALDEIRRRTDALGFPHGIPTTLHYFSFPQLTLDTAAGAELFTGWARQMIATVGRVDVVILDTASRFLDGDENESGPWLQMYRRAFLPLKRLGVAVLRLDHPGKDESKGARGSSAKYADVDVALHLTATPAANDTTRVVIEVAKQRSGSYPARVEWTRSTIGGVLGHRAATGAEVSIAAWSESSDVVRAIAREMAARVGEKFTDRNTAAELSGLFGDQPRAVWRAALRLYRLGESAPGPAEPGSLLDKIENGGDEISAQVTAPFEAEKRGVPAENECDGAHTLVDQGAPPLAPRAGAPPAQRGANTFPQLSGSAQEGAAQPAVPCAAPAAPYKGAGRAPDIGAEADGGPLSHPPGGLVAPWRGVERGPA